MGALHYHYYSTRLVLVLGVGNSSSGTVRRGKIRKGKWGEEERRRVMEGEVIIIIIIIYSPQ